MMQSFSIAILFGTKAHIKVLSKKRKEALDCKLHSRDLPLLLAIAIEEDPVTREADVKCQSHLKAGHGHNAQTVLEDDSQNFGVRIGLLRSRKHDTRQ